MDSLSKQRKLSDMVQRWAQAELSGAIGNPTATPSSDCHLIMQELQQIKQFLFQQSYPRAQENAIYQPSVPMQQISSNEVKTILPQSETDGYDF
ncbi:hypothetical protein [Paenibacillus sp. y28]|uniref:hypothetical protein n=1 Tax=Paenibacillus sp. y28 TaxID=3129110 RepID=UPI0030160CD9